MPRTEKVSQENLCPLNFVAVEPKTKRPHKDRTVHHDVAPHNNKPPPRTQGSQDGKPERTDEPLEADAGAWEIGSAYPTNQFQQLEPEPLGPGDVYVPSGFQPPGEVW